MQAKKTETQQRLKAYFNRNIASFIDSFYITFTKLVPVVEIEQLNKTEKIVVSAKKNNTFF